MCCGSIQGRTKSNELPSSNPFATVENPQQIGNPERILSNSRIEKWIDCMDPPDDHERFTRLLIEHEPQLLRCVLVAVPNRADARDIMQECSVALWRRFSKYEVERPFVPWAFGFVRMEVRRFLRSSRRRAQLTERAAELLLQDEQTHAEELGVREQYLKHCVDRLPSDPQVGLEIMSWFCYATEPGLEITHAFGSVRVAGTLRRADGIRRLTRVRWSVPTTIPLKGQLK